MNRRLLAAIGVLTLLAGSFPATLVAAPGKAQETGNKLLQRAPDNVYIVLLRESAAVAYTGGINGYAATAPEAGKKFDSSRPSVRKYAAYLESRHNAVLDAVGVSTTNKLYSYAYALNGFAAQMPHAKAVKIAGMTGVASVEPDRLKKAQTDNSPDFLGLTDGSGGLWEDLGLTGEDVIVGVVDTGIWPEHPSFSDQSDLADRPGQSGKRTSVYDAPTGWNGTCQSGELWSQDDCNNKLIGARYFLAGFEKHGIIHDDYKSARDADGHGTHTASTAAGNAGVEASIFGQDFGAVSGVAPRARVAAYKALWNDEGGFTSDLAAAINAAVGDGVDVINYSIGSDSPTFFSADDIAFLNATQPSGGGIGVFAAVSAGNAGPGAGTVGSPASVPWVMTVGASTQDRTFEGSVTLGNAATYFGASVTEGTDTLSLVDAEDAALDGVDDVDAARCFEDTLDPAVVAGKIVLCVRGVTARLDKSREVLRAGGAGMILYDNSATGSLITDNHWVPSVHISLADGEAIKDYIDIAGAGATANIDGGAKVAAQGSVMANFSSRGPNGAEADFLKPDVTAPGVNILAGNTPTPFLGRPGQLFQSISGTSMSSPHVAGLGALLRELHPTWGFDEVKSALMLTARQDVVKEDGSTDADVLDYGAGHVAPNSAANPGVVLNESRANFLRYICLDFMGVVVSPATCTAVGGALRGTDVNLPSIAVGQLVGDRTVSRTFRSVDAGSTTWTASVEGLAGIDVTLPGPIVLASGASATWEVTFATDTAELGEWATGFIVFTADDGREVRLPVAVKPEPIAAPLLQTISTTNETTDASWDVTVGYDGELSADGWGLAADDALAGQFVAQDPDQDPETDTFTSGTQSYDFVAGANTRYFAGGTLDETTTAGSDLDVFLLYELEDGETGFSFDDLISFAADGDSTEIVEAILPAAGNYRVLVHGWGTPGGGGSTYTFHRWQVDQAAADAGTLVATAGSGDPLTVSSSDVVSISADISGLTSVGQYRGLVGYDDGTDVLATTVLIVNRN